MSQRDSSHPANPRLHPKNHAPLISADQRKSDHRSSHGYDKGADPRVEADGLPEEGSPQQLEKLRERIIFDDKLVLARKKIWFPHHRSEKKQNGKPVGYDLNDLAISHACHGA